MCVCTMGFSSFCQKYIKGIYVKGQHKTKFVTQLTINQTVFTYVNRYMKRKCYITIYNIYFNIDV